MKLVAHMPDGARIEAGNYMGLVQQLKIDCPFPEPSIEDYMKKVTKRVRTFHSKKISFSTPEEFISEMIRIGEIKAVLIKNENGRK